MIPFALPPLRTRAASQPVRATMLVCAFEAFSTLASGCSD